MSGPKSPLKGDRLSLAFNNIDDIPLKIIQLYARYVRTLDLTDNNISNLSALRSFVELETLVADSNCLTAFSLFPPLPKLKTLWVNKNEIDNLVAFIDTLVTSCPYIEHLSMLGNEACPNYMNGGSPKQYSDFRLYTISRLHSLITLNDELVQETEKSKAMEVYGKLDQKVAKTPTQQRANKKKIEKVKKERASKDKQAIKEDKKKRREKRAERNAKKAAVEKKSKRKKSSETSKKKSAPSAVDDLPTVDDLGLGEPEQNTVSFFDNSGSESWTDSQSL